MVYVFKMSQSGGSLFISFTCSSLLQKRNCIYFMSECSKCISYFYVCNSMDVYIYRLVWMYISIKRTFWNKVVVKRYCNIIIRLLPSSNNYINILVCSMSNWSNIKKRLDGIV